VRRRTERTAHRQAETHTITTPCFSRRCSRNRSSDRDKPNPPQRETRLDGACNRLMPRIPSAASTGIRAAPCSSAAAPRGRSSLRPEGVPPSTNRRPWLLLPAVLNPVSLPPPRAARLRRAVSPKVVELQERSWKPVDRSRLETLFEMDHWPGLPPWLASLVPWIRSLETLLPEVQPTAHPGPATERHKASRRLPDPSSATHTEAMLGRVAV